MGPLIFFAIYVNPLLMKMPTPRVPASTTPPLLTRVLNAKMLSKMAIKLLCVTNAVNGYTLRWSLATNLYRPLPWLLANLSVPWPIRDNFWQHILKEISHIYNISLKLFRLTKIGIIPSFGTRKCKNRIFWTFFSKMEKNVKFGQKFTPGEPNTFKNGSFCYLIFSKKFSLPISEKKISLKLIDQIWLKNQQKVNFDPIR